MDEATALQRMVAPAEHRPGKWPTPRLGKFGGVMQIWVTRQCDKACFGCTQGSNLRGKSPPITPAQFEEVLLSLRPRDPDGYPGVIGMFGGNPCAAAGTLVYTTDGIYPVEELEGRAFSVLNSRGDICPATCWHAGSGRQLYEVTLRGGHTYYVTAEHEWPALSLQYGPNHKRKDLPDYNPRKTAVALGKVKTCDLRPGMRLPIGGCDDLGFGRYGTADDGFLAGWALGDGWVLPVAAPGGDCGRLQKTGRRTGKLTAAHNYRGLGLVVSAVDADAGITDKLTQQLRQLGSAANFRAARACYEITAQHVGVDTWMSHFGLLGKQDGLPLTTWTTASEAFRKGLIDGLFSADGNVEISRARGYVRIRLTSAHEKLVQDVSKLLGFYGIKTQLERRERVGCFPNGKDYGKTYVSYTLSVSNVASVCRFARLFPLTHTQKQARLQSALGRHKDTDVEATNIEIVSITPTDRYEDVWDISVADDTHTFQLAHCVTGNCLHPQFEELCALVRKYVPKERAGIWCNKPFGKAPIMRQTFTPHFSNLNVHLDRAAYDEFKRDWPESRPCGLDSDSRHSPVFTALQDLVPDEGERWAMISSCDINHHWSAMFGAFRGEARFWFCEIAGAQAILHQDDPNWPDTGRPVTPDCWRGAMADYADQVRFHCHRCGIPFRGHGELAQASDAAGVEQVSQTHADIYKPKRPSRTVQLVQLRTDVREATLPNMVDYIGNARKK